MLKARRYARLSMRIHTNSTSCSAFHADVSPDGNQIVYSSCEFRTERGIQSYSERRDYNYEIAVISQDGTGQQRLTTNHHLDHHPVWSPDGSRIAFLASPKNTIPCRCAACRTLYDGGGWVGCAIGRIHAEESNQGRELKSGILRQNCPLRKCNKGKNPRILKRHGLETSFFCRQCGHLMGYDWHSL